MSKRIQMMLAAGAGVWVVRGGRCGRCGQGLQPRKSSRLPARARIQIFPRWYLSEPDTWLIIAITPLAKSKTCA